MTSLRLACALLLTLVLQSLGTASSRPNIILILADDLGWGDVGFNGNTVIQTPNLDALAAQGIKLHRFYAASPVCSPTRGSALTGRHPDRYGIRHANVGHLKDAEVSLAEVLREAGYATGHFGKWHLGTLTRSVVDSNRGGRPTHADHYSPPWDHGFDVCFSTEAKVPTYDPMWQPATPPPGGEKWWLPADEDGRAPYGTAYWTGPGQEADGDLSGDDSRVIMDRVLPFVRSTARRDQPFFAVVWFHAPHWPVVASAQDRSRYAGYSPFQQSYYGCITALDREVGRLAQALQELGEFEDTFILFSSDNGPEGNPDPDHRFHGVGSAGPFRGRKRDLLEGGIRVPSFALWPARLPAGSASDVPGVSTDFSPTVLSIVGLQPPPDRPIDGEDLMPIWQGQAERRGSNIKFSFQRKRAVIGDRYKLHSDDGGATYALYDLMEDPAESRDLSSQRPALVKDLIAEWEAWRASCQASQAGADYRATTTSEGVPTAPSQ